MLLIPILLLQSAFANPPQSFTHLKKVETNGNGTLYVDPSVKCASDRQPRTQRENIDTGFHPPVYELCTVTIKGIQMRISFTRGPSEDPTFEIIPTKSGIEPTSLDGTRLYIPKGDNLYVDGWSNTMYNQRRKYTFNGKQFEEIKQPFYYVGLKTKISFKDTPEVQQKFVVLYQEKNTDKTVAVLPEGSEIEVLLSDGEHWYLVRSSFGLVGWVQAMNGERNTPIGVSFAGD